MSTPIDTDCTDEIVCPHCGEVGTDSWEYAEDYGEIECGSCSETLTYERHVEVTYTTWKRESMTPEEARAHLTDMETTRSFYVEPSEALRALETIAAMTKETDGFIVNPDTNGGRYETRIRTRYVTEWKE